MGSANPILFGGGPSNQSVYEVVTTARHLPGTRGQLSDGRSFEYVRSDNATAIGKGKLACYDPIVAAVDKIAIQAAADIGATSVAVTVTLTVTAGELNGSYLSIDDDAGEAELYGIIGHDDHTSGTLTLNIDREVVVAMTTNTTATIVFSANAVKISAAVVAQANPVEVAAGVPLVSIGAGDTTPQFFWVQKKGIANVLFGAVVGAVGRSVYHGETAGSFQSSTMDHADTTDRDEKVSLGTIATLLPVVAEYHPIYLDIA